MDDLSAVGIGISSHFDPSHRSSGAREHSFGGGTTITLPSSRPVIKTEQCDQPFVVDEQQLSLYHELLMEGGVDQSTSARQQTGGIYGWPTSSSTPSTTRSYTSSTTATETTASISARHNCAGPLEPTSQVDVYRDLILRHLLQDISTTCAKLSLSTNPLLWDVDDCVAWIVEQCHQFQLGPAPSKPRLLQALPALQFGGRWMMGMSVDDFCRCVPEGGDTLHAQLQLWKTATCDDATTSLDSRGMNISKAHSAFEFTAQQAPSSKDSTYAATTRHNNQLPLAAEGGDVTDDDSSGSSNSGEFHPIPFLPFSGRSCIMGPEQTSARHHPFLLENHPQSLPFLHSGARMEAARAAGALTSSSTGVLIGASTLTAAGHHSSGSSIVGGSNGMELTAMAGGGGDVAEHGRLCPHQSRILSAAHCGTSSTIHLWHFIRELLDQPDEYGACVRWVDREEGTFKIESSHSLARYWGLRKNRSAMNYDKLSRSLRQYYKKGIIRKPEKKQRLVYKFLPPYNL